MARKRYQGYRPTNTKAPASDRPAVSPSTVVSIDHTAMAGRAGLVVGERVRILGSGLYAGELAVVERLVHGPIPSASVRTDAGLARLARTVDLEPVPRSDDRP